MNRAPKSTQSPAGGRSGLFWDLLTFDRMLSGQVIHLIYWCGLGLIALIGFGVIGAAIGIAIRGGSVEGTVVAIPVLVGGFLMIGAMVLLWRGACEFYIAVLSIAGDLKALRAAAQRGDAPKA